MGCLFAMLGGLVPRFALLSSGSCGRRRSMPPSTPGSSRCSASSSCRWLLYAVLWTVGGLSGWAWFWVVLAALLDIGHAATAAANRQQLAPPSYQSGPTI
jgi:hypothetical protein